LLRRHIEWNTEHSARLNTLAHIVIIKVIVVERVHRAPASAAFERSQPATVHHSVSTTCDDDWPGRVIRRRLPQPTPRVRPHAGWPLLHEIPQRAPTARLWTAGQLQKRQQAAEQPWNAHGTLPILGTRGGPRRSPALRVSAELLLPVLARAPAGARGSGGAYC